MRKSQKDVVCTLADNTPSQPLGLVMHTVKYSNGKLSSDINGFVETPYGFVKVSAYYMDGKPKSNNSTLEIIKNRRIYYRHFNRAYNENGLIKKATEFAKELNG